MIKLLGEPGETLASVGRLFGISPQRVQQLVNQESYERGRRRTRNRGRYRCRACGKLGHTKRSPDCPKARP